MNRRTFLKTAGASAFGVKSFGLGTERHGSNRAIDRKALVGRHKVVLTRPERLSPLSVGNGEFAFTADITGLQTFPEFHQGGMLLQTMAQWSFHSTPDPHNYKLSDTFDDYEYNGRLVPYPSGDESGDGFGDGSPAAQWLNANPHRFDLGQIGLILPGGDGQPVKIEDLTDVHQELNLWTGLISSRFTLHGQQVLVETVAHPHQDALAVRITSPLVATGQVGIRLRFPYASDDWLRAADWNQSDRHTTHVIQEHHQVRFTRQFDGTTQYVAQAGASAGSTFVELGTHEFTWMAKGVETHEFVIGFSPGADPNAHLNQSTFVQIRKASSQHWEKFWSTGGAIDLSESRDPRWFELERRIVLSQYQTAINSAGSLPPQETGLVQNSWHGKFHLEMHWWHSAHFALWGREDLLMRSLGYYRRILPVARETAHRIGCKGARWPKNVGPEGRESPNRINPFLTWEQPHPIHFAELMYQARPTRETLDFFKEIVMESAEFMASFVVWSPDRKCFEMGPPIVAPYENNFRERKTSKNPSFDLAYWAWALGVAQHWRERLGMDRDETWEHVRKNLAPLPVREGIYCEIEQVDAGHSGHPSMLAALGVVPEAGKVDHPTMQQTVDLVAKSWPRDDMWGWDFPMLAMAAARIGRPDQAVEALLMETTKNSFLANGHNFQQDILPLYLPGNGGLLFAVALMTAGWKDGPKSHAPGFPSAAAGWSVHWEGLRPAL